MQRIIARARGESATMSARRAKQEFKEGLEKLENVMEAVIEKHVGPTIVQERSALMVVLGFIPHLVILGFSAYVVWVAKPSSSLFSWHPTLMSIAFIVLMTEGIMVFSRWSSPVMATSKSTKFRWHWVLQTCCAIAVYTGLAIITCNKYLNNSQHYTTWHGNVGIFICGLMAIAISGGIVQAYPEILPFKMNLVTLRRIHALSEMFIYFGGLATIILGLYSSWFVANVPRVAWLACVGAPVVLGAAVFLQVIRNRFVTMFKR